MTQTLTTRVDSDDKKAFEDFCSSVGLTASAALNMFVKATLREGQIPFAIKSQKFNSKVGKPFKKQTKSKMVEQLPKFLKTPNLFLKSLIKNEQSIIDHLYIRV